MADALIKCISAFDFSLESLIDEVNEEIKMRRYVYANQVLKGVKTRSIADRKIAAMEEVARILKGQKDGHIIRTECTIYGHPILIECQGRLSPIRAQNLKDTLKLIIEKANDNGD